jgi:hypothetical protein
VTNTCTEYATVSTGVACTANFTSGLETASVSEPGPLAARNAPEPKGSARGGSVPPTGTLLEDLLGAGSDPQLKREREAGLKRLREQASQGSRGLADEEPALEYLLGGDE